ncbi:MAG: phospholipid scramblase-related protein [Bdellovibrionota bacterium]
MASFDLANLRTVLVTQVHELGEWFGFETRNKYQIMNKDQVIIGYAAEQQKGILGLILRQYLDTGANLMCIFSLQTVNSH